MIGSEINLLDLGYIFKNRKVVKSSLKVFKLLMFEKLWSLELDSIEARLRSVRLINKPSSNIFLLVFKSNLNNPHVG